ncbi:MAG: NAD-dependent epimerase/dehydratase family protein [bacterium]
MKIFITGGTGFIGRHVIEKLRSQEFPAIFALTRKKERGREPDVFYIEGDICDTSLIHDCAGDADYIIHMAGCKNDPHLFFKTNVEGTKNIIQACSTNNTLRKLIYVSSVGVIGDVQDVLIDEETVCHPNNEYERSKYQAELIVREYSAQNPGKVIIVRPTNVFGENDPDLHLLNLFRKIKHHCFFFVGRDISQYYVNNVYVKELSELIAQLLTLSPPHDVYILNTPTPLSQFILMIKEILKDKTPIKHLPYWPIKLIAHCFDCIPKELMRNPPINTLKLTELTNRKQYCASLLAKDLPWQPAFTMEEALANLIAHYDQKKLLA